MNTTELKQNENQPDQKKNTCFLKKQVSEMLNDNTDKKDKLLNQLGLEAPKWAEKYKLGNQHLESLLNTQEKLYDIVSPLPVFQGFPKTELWRLFMDGKDHEKGILGFEVAEQKLAAAIECCQNLDQLHAFADGNVRTATLVLNKFLIELGEYACIFDNPNVLDVKSIRELMQYIMKGKEKLNHINATNDKIVNTTLYRYRKRKTSFKDIIEDLNLVVYGHPHQEARLIETSRLSQTNPQLAGNLLSSTYQMSHRTER